MTRQVQDPSAVDPRLDTQLYEYRIVARVADGAMGRVYEGKHISSGARVAIKVLHPEVTQDAVAVERFRREFETAESFDHPYIVRVVGFGSTTDGADFMVMEYLEGKELSLRLRERGALPPEEFLRIAAQVALALEHAHSFGVIHRDLKPENIFLCDSPEGPIVRVLDFGSVKLQVETGPKLTTFGTTLGSPYYMSPEQALGRRDVDQRSDVFALAAIVYEMATGRTAFEGESVGEILMKIMNDQPTSPRILQPSLPPRFEDVVDRGLAKDKQRRFATATELADALLQSFGLQGGAALWAPRSLQEFAIGLEDARSERARQESASAKVPESYDTTDAFRTASPTAPRSSAPPSAASLPSSGKGRYRIVGAAIALGLVGFALWAAGLF